MKRIIVIVRQDFAIFQFGVPYTFGSTETYFYASGFKA